MDYRTIEREIRNNCNGFCALDDWIIDCRGFISTQIVAFNLFVEIHIGSMDDASFMQNIFDMDRHLATRKMVPPNDRIKDMHFSVHNLTSIHTTIHHGCKLSRIVELSSMINRFDQYVNGHNIDKSGSKRDEIAIDKLLKETEDFLNQNNSVLPYTVPKRPNEINLVWFTNSDEIKTSLHGNTYDATTVRDLLGLLHFRSGRFYLVEYEYDYDMQNNPQKPVVFHSRFADYWRPSFRSDGWGTTLNLKTFSDGVSETVFLDANWPKGTFKKLGHCRELQIPNEHDQWKTYLDRRINDFKKWPGFNDSKREDLEYFLNKWK